MVEAHSAILPHVAWLPTSVANDLLALHAGGDLCFFGGVILAFFVVTTLLLLLLIGHLLSKVNIHGHWPSVVLRVEGFSISTLFTFLVFPHRLVELLARGHVKC